MKRNKNNKASSKQTSTFPANSSVIFWLMTAITIGFLFIAPFRKALFNGGSYQFEGAIYGSIIWSSILLFLAAIYLFKLWKVEDERNMFAVFVWLIPLSFLIPVFSAASTHAAINSVYVHVLYAIFFISGIYITKNKLGLSLLKWSLLGSGYVIVLFGFMNLFGDASIFGWINYSENSSAISNTYKDAVMFTHIGMRITSVFQYANTYAAYLIGLLLASLILISSSRRWYVVGLGSFMLVPILISFILTLSRGGIVVFPIILVLVLPFLKLSRQITVGIHFVVAFLASVFIMDHMSTIGQELQTQFSAPFHFKGWLILLFTSIIVALISYAVERYVSIWISNNLEKYNKFRASNLILPFLGIVLGFIGFFALFGNTGLTTALPDSLQQRIESINFQQHSVLERGTFYSNSLEVIKDHAVVGAGGGAWSALYEKYQTNPYTSRQAHNFFLQHFIEVGLIGFIILILFLSVIFYGYTKNHFTKQTEGNDDRLIFFSMAIAILIHSIIDFNMSYVYIGTLVFLSLGVMAANVLLPNKLQILQSKKWIKFYPLALILLSIIIFIGSIRLYQADNLFKLSLKKLEQQKPLHEVLKPLDKSVSITDHPEYMNYKISILRQAHDQLNDEKYITEAQDLIQLVKEKEPHNRQILDQKFALLLTQGDSEKALQVISDGIRNFPWDISLYERAIGLNVEIGALNSEDSTNLHWNQAMELYETVLSKVNELEQLPEEQNQGRAFEVTQQMQKYIDQIQFEG